MKIGEKMARSKSLIIIPAAIFLLFATTYLLWNTNYRGKVYPGVMLGSINLGGQDYNSVKKVITMKTQDIEDDGVVFIDDAGNKVIKDNKGSLDAGSNYQFILFAAEKTALTAFDKSKNDNFFLFLTHLLKNKNSKKIYNQLDVDAEGLQYFLEESFPDLMVSFENAYFYIANDSQTLSIMPGKIGKSIDHPSVYEALYKNLKSLNNELIYVKTISLYPSVKEADLLDLKAEAEKILSRSQDFELKYTNNKGLETSWQVKPEQLVSWLEINHENNNSVSLNEDRISAYLSENLTKLTDKEIVLPRFEMLGEKINSWQVGEDGQELDIYQSAKNIKTAFLNEESVANLIIEKVSVDNFVSENDFKIKEVIGSGHSSFVGSSANRIHNIKTGAEALNGLLIKPGEEFSLLNALGEIDGEHGYVTELVIKGDETIPEYGGGLCQVGTTMFRTAIQTGLPITMRRNHSYRVSYYEPAGTDATIYDPWPDFKFINDTPNYILIQYRMEGYDLYFDFWGVSDGRQVEITDPVIYNIVKPPDTKYIETDKLAPGEEKCTEKSHNGASAYFDYKVTYPQNSTTTEVVETRFNSYYVPWQAVCLIGKELETASSSDTVINEVVASSSPIN